MDCEKALELMSAELDGACTEQERAALQAHLDACADCRETFRQLHALDEALQDAQLEPPQALHDTVMRQIRKEKKPGRRFWLPAAAIAAAAALVLLAGYAGLLSLPGFDRENAVTVNVGSAAERIFEQIEPEAGEPDPAAAGEAAELSARTQLDVLLMWGQGIPAELRGTPYETTKTGSRLYRVTGALAQSLLDRYATALYAADGDFSDLPEQEEACVLVWEGENAAAGSAKAGADSQ